MYTQTHIHIIHMYTDTYLHKYICMQIYAFMCVCVCVCVCVLCVCVCVCVCICVCVVCVCMSLTGVAWCTKLQFEVKTWGVLSLPPGSQTSTPV